jgi:hypothetical protein
MEYQVNSWETDSLEELDKAINSFIETEGISIINVSTSAYFSMGYGAKVAYVGTLLYKPNPI